MKRNQILVYICLVCFFLPFYGCGRRTGKEVVLALIGGTKITVTDFNERIANLPIQYRDVIKKRKREYLEELINDTLLYKEALKKKIYRDSDVQKVIGEAKRKILIARLLKDEVDDVINIKEEEIVNFYYANQSKYMTPEVMRASHILVPSRKEAKAILEKLLSGTEFEELAKAKSVDPTARRGGDIGYFAKGQLMSRFENACSRLEVGEISGIVKTELGYHIIKLTDRKAPKLKPIEEVSDNIKSKLYASKRQKLLTDLLDKLKAKAVIKINDKVLSEDEDRQKK